MTWFRVDDGFWSHPKTVGLSDAAVALWVRAGAYASQHLTDGVIPAPVLRMVGDKDAAQELVAVGLWTETAGEYEFHDWGEYQETSTVVKARQAAARERQRRSRAARDAKAAGTSRSARQQTENVTEDVTRDNTREFSTPDPTRPDQVVTNVTTYPPTPRCDEGTVVPLRPTREGESGNAANHLPAVSRSRQAVDRLNRTSRSAAANRFAEQFSQSLPEPIESRTRSEIAVQIDHCLKDEISPEAIAEGLRLWHESDSFAPSQIPKFVTKATARKRPGRTKPTTQARSAADLAEQMIREGYASA